MTAPVATDKKLHCYHCGELCSAGTVRLADKIFCCEGCKMVYQIIDQNNLCTYYYLNERPGINQRTRVRKDQFAFLEDEKIALKLISFRDNEQTHITFYLPQVHCSSCLYLLENLHRFNKGIVSAKVNFARKEVAIVFLHSSTSLRVIAELLTAIGYEPHISLNDLTAARPVTNKSMIYQLGVAGFCFGNIMLMSFPEYLGVDASEAGLRSIFRWANFILAIPVFLYSALPFYISSWKSLRHKFLNIDAPIALAIIITFMRSAWEVLFGTGGGYFDSMSGIIFFMLIGRILQDKTYRQLSFERDYTSYFPIAVSVVKEDKEIPTALPGIKAGDTLRIHHDEFIPADGILTGGKAFIDYSFVTGESLPVVKEIGEIIYAGGKQTGGNAEILVIKEVAQSYLAKLWEKDEFKKNEHKKSVSFVHLLSRYFTYIVLLIAAITAAYWALHDTSRLWPAVTAVFIIACPCALLLSGTFTNGNILSILGRNHFYLRNAQVIEDIAGIDHIVFDKTGTLTSLLQQDIVYEGTPLSDEELQMVASLVRCSAHPLSKALEKYFTTNVNREVSAFEEITGKGIQGFVQQHWVMAGSKEYITGIKDKEERTVVYVSIDNIVKGRFIFSNHYRDFIPSLLERLKKNYRLSVITGDNTAERDNLKKLLGEKATLLFRQRPEDKPAYIRRLQQNGERVMMIGDGLNDAGALKQSNIGIAVAERTNNFTPASDAIIEAGKLMDLPAFVRLCRINKYIITTSFVLSIGYNIIGLSFAVQGNLSPLIAAILMPASSLSILLITFGSSSFFARRMHL